jgi:antitoxin (DNA-binding transcriptional repressor) of toxin-antitoxin stability system
LIDRAAKGEPFIIATAGKPLVKVVPLEADGNALINITDKGAIQK